MSTTLQCPHCGEEFTIDEELEAYDEPMSEEELRAYKDYLMVEKAIYHASDEYKALSEKANKWWKLISESRRNIIIELMNTRYGTFEDVTEYIVCAFGRYSSDYDLERLSNQ